MSKKSKKAALSDVWTPPVGWMASGITIVASDHPPRDVPSLDELVAEGVAARLSVLRTSSRMFMTTANAVDLFRTTREGVDAAEDRLHWSLRLARAELNRVLADGWAGLPQDI